MNKVETVFDRNPALSKPGGRAAWAESFAPVLAELRMGLGSRSPEQLARRAGILWQPEESAFHVQLLDRRYRLSWPQLVASPVDAEEPCGAELQALFLYYMDRATGAQPENRWVTFRELPDGGFYHRAFESYTGDPLAVTIDNNLDCLQQAAIAIGGYPLSLGDMGFCLLGLPRIPLALVYWLGDDEFPPEAQVLFDPVASDYLPIDGSAALGRRLVQRLLAVLGKDESP